MRRHQRAPVLRACATCAAILLWAAAASAQQSPLTITAQAIARSEGTTAAATPLRVDLHRLSTEADYSALRDAVKRGGTAAARVVLTKATDLGTVDVGGVRTPIKFAQRRPTGDGESLTIVTTDPIPVVGAGLAHGHAPAGYGLGLLVVAFPMSGAPYGEVKTSTEIHVTGDGAIVSHDYHGAVVELSTVVRQ